MSTVGDPDQGTPVFKAVSSSTRQLFQLLNCIRFAPKATIQIFKEGIRFAAEEGKVSQGIVFLDNKLFTSFNVNLPEPTLIDDDSNSVEPPSFQISLAALLETLQIFGAADTATSRFSKPDNDGYTSNIRPGRQNAFSNQALGMAGICRLSYAGEGSPFSIILEESGVTTICNLNTYTVEDNDGEIPFERDALQVKIIMQARWLFDAVQELASTSPTRLDITAYPAAPYLSLSSVGAHGSATVEFAKGRDLLETFTVAERWTQSYKFEMIKDAAEAMRLASKVSIRGDEQGVLSLQFMVEVEGAGVNFVDFRFVPFLPEDEEDEYEEDEEEEEGEEDENLGI